MAKERKKLSPRQIEIFVIVFGSIVSFLALLCVSSTKSEMGHALGAAGAIELIISVMALNNGMVPPTINLDEPDPECDLNYTPNTPVKADLDIAISNSLGFGGHNACLAIRKVK